jgi:hypothetical protein
MECILVRHGIAVEPDEWEGEEENLPLMEKGKNVFDRLPKDWRQSTVSRPICLRARSCGPMIRRGFYGRSSVRLSRARREKNWQSERSPNKLLRFSARSRLMQSWSV